MPFESIGHDLSEIAVVVVDNFISSDVAQIGLVCRTRGRGHMGTDMFGKLNGEAATPPAPRWIRILSPGCSFNISSMALSAVRPMSARRRRIFQSAPLTLAATTSMTTPPGPATGSGKSPYFKTSGPPNCLMKAAFIVFLPLRFGADGLIARRGVRRMVHRACDQAMAAS